jgi:hypothetical protein
VQVFSLEVHNMLKRLLLMLCFMCSLFQTNCCFGDVSRAGVLFLLIDPDARAGGMGGASVALTDDALATHYNPAGITGVKLVSGELSYCQWLPELASNLHYAHGSGVINLADLGYTGVDFTYLSLGENVRTDEYGNVKGTFNSYELATAVSYALQLTDDFSSGLSAKFIYSHLAERGAGMEKGKATGTTFALDLGMLYKNILPELTFSRSSQYPNFSKFFGNRKSHGLSLGLVISNIGPDISYEDLDQKDPLPRELRIGTAYRAVDTDIVGVNLAIDYCQELVDGSDFIIKGGFEATFLYLLTLRYGYYNDEAGDVKHQTWGVGIGPEWGRFNASFVPKGNRALSGTTKFSLNFDYPVSLF